MSPFKVGAHDEHIDADPYDLLPALEAGQVRVLRQSTLGTADTCLQRLEFDLDPKISYTTGEARAVGTGYHAGLEHYYRGRKANGFYVPGDGALNDIIKVAIDSFDLEAGTPGFEWLDGADRAHEKIELMLRAYFAGEHYWPAEYDIVAVEHTFLYPLFQLDGDRRWIVKGTVDLIVRDPNGWLIPVDHKSAKKPWKKGKESHRSTNQPSWYVNFLRKIFEGENVASTFVFDIMTYGGQFERRPVEVRQHHIDGVLRKAEQVCALIEGGGPYPPNTSSFLCDPRWCDHWKRCAFGEAFDVGVPVSIGAKP